MALSIRMTLDGETRELDLDSMLISEARELKKVTGWDYLTWRAQLGQSDPDAVAFAWWIANKRAGTPIAGSFFDLDFDMAKMDAEAIVDDEIEPEDNEDDAEGPTG